MRRPLIALLFVALFAPSLPHFAQEPQKAAPQDQEEERIVTTTAEVALDIVVKDKKGRPVKDLSASDFEIYEDGVRQEVKSFRIVTRSADESGEMTARGERPSAPSARPSPLGLGPAGLSAVAIVFDRLSPDARIRASKAALSYLGNQRETSDYIGVFAIDQTLHVLQPFTRDAQLARQAINAITERSTSTYASSASQMRSLLQQQTSLEANAEASISAATSNAGPGGSTSVNSVNGASLAEQMMTAMMIRILDTFERLERDQQGFATTNALLSVVNALGRITGRKAILFFSEGVAIPPNVLAEFRSVISNANRANVSIYTVDAAGLRAESTTAETQREIQSLGLRRINQVSTGREDTSGRPMTLLLERNEDVLRLDPHSGLGELAEATGGLLIGNTNDLNTRLRQIDQDLHTYYVLTYTPKNQNYDGRFRQITVKLNRPGFEVQTRKGYYAINAAIASPVLAYEALALAALSGTHRTNAFPLHVGGFSFPEPDHPGLVSVLVDVPNNAITYASDLEKKIYRTDFVIVALIKDESLRVVRKLSNQYVLTGPLDKLEEAKRGGILFYREAELPPGRYTISVAAYDALTGRASVESRDVEVPSAGPNQLRLSSLAILKRAERLSAEEQKRANPFHFGEVLVYPNLGEPLSKATTKQLAFFVTAYAPQGTRATPKLILEILQRGRALGRTAIDLPAPDAAGRIQYASALPIEKLQAGEYELRVTVTDGATKATRAESFTVQ